MTYDEMFQAFQNGTLSEQDWHAYCRDLLDSIMAQNRDVFIRLKDR